MVILVYSSLARVGYFDDFIQGGLGIAFLEKTVSAAFKMRFSLERD